MKQIGLILILLLSFTCFAEAQKTAIVKDLNSDKAGQGTIRIYQDESIEDLIGSKNLSSTNVSSETDNSLDPNASETKPSHHIQTRGYKIQIFSGNDQKRSKAEAYSRRDLIKSSFPNMEVAITYNSPVWRARAGNYKTHEQAREALNELKAAFPSFGKEMQIVESVVKLPVY